MISPTELPGNPGGAVEHDWWDRLRYPVVAVLLATFLIVGWLGREPTMSAAGEDEMVYLALSKSLEQGSYREIYKPSAPLHVKYPPGYPAWLMIVRHTVGEDHDRIRAVNLLLTAGALFLLFAVARRLMGTGLALGFLLLLALNRSLLLAGGALVSEGLFLLFAAGALALTLASPARAPRAAILAIILALAAFLIRSQGLAVVLTIGAWLWWRHRRAFWGWAVASILVVGGWFAYGELVEAGLSMQSYRNQFIARRLPPSESLLHVVLSRVWRHGVSYATSDMPYALSLPTIRGTAIDNWAWLALTGFLLTTGWLIFWRKWRAAAAYLILSIVLVLVWPWASLRYIIPLVPFGLLAFLLGGKRVAGLLPLRLQRPTLGVLVALLAIGGLQGARERIERFRDCDRSRPFENGACYDENTLALAAAAKYLRSHAAPSDVILTRNAASTYFLTGHLAAIPSNVLPGPINEMMDRLRASGIRFILLSDRASHRRAAIDLLPSCHSFRVEATFPPEALLLAVAAPGAPGQDACSALMEFIGDPESVVRAERPR